MPFRGAVDGRPRPMLRMGFLAEAGRLVGEDDNGGGGEGEGGGGEGGGEGGEGGGGEGGGDAGGGKDCGDGSDPNSGELGAQTPFCFPRRGLGAGKACSSTSSGA